MSAYVIFDVDIYDRDQYQEFVRQVKPAIESAGGKYLVRGGASKVYEGEWQPRRVMMFEFPSVEAFEAFYYSPLYQNEVKPIRDACSTARVVSFEGI